MSPCTPPVSWYLQYQWKVLTVLNNSPPVCLCVVDVNKEKSQREGNKSNHNILLSTMQKIYISFVSGGGPIHAGVPIHTHPQFY